MLRTTEFHICPAKIVQNKRKFSFYLQSVFRWSNLSFVVYPRDLPFIQILCLIMELRSNVIQLSAAKKLLHRLRSCFYHCIFESVIFITELLKTLKYFNTFIRKYHHKLNYPIHKCSWFFFFLKKHKSIYRVDKKILLPHSTEQSTCSRDGVTFSSMYLDWSSPYTNFTATFLRKKKKKSVCPTGLTRRMQTHFRPF